MKIIMQGIIFYVLLFLVLVLTVTGILKASERHHGTGHDSKPAPVVIINNSETVNVTNVNKRVSQLPNVQHQFNPDSKKYQLSVGMATSDFEGNNAVGISMGKRICNAECESAFWHGSLNSNGSQTSGGIGVTFSWD